MYIGLWSARHSRKIRSVIVKTIADTFANSTRLLPTPKKNLRLYKLWSIKFQNNTLKNYTAWPEESGM